MTRLFAHLYKIRPRPGLYLTHASLPLLNAYIKGYVHGRDDDDIDDDWKSLCDFQAFLEKKHGFLEPSPLGWCKIIMQHSDSEGQAFDRFFELLDEFLQSREAQSNCETS